MTDALSGSAIPNVTVTISQRHTTGTDNDGEYELSQIKPGDYTITLSKTGYIDLEENLTVNAGDVLTRDFVLIPKSGPVVTDLKVTPDPTSGSGVITVTGIARSNVTSKIAPFTSIEKISYSMDTSNTNRSKTAVLQSIEVGNLYFRARVNHEGEFIIWTSSNKRLLYAGNYSGVTLIRVDGTSYVFGSSDGVWTTPLYATTNQIRGVWTIDDIEVVFTLSIVQGTTTKRFDSFKVSYNIRNKGSATRSIGMFKGFDTMINTNDTVPISAGNGYSRNEREFVGSDIPNFWQAYETGPDQIREGLVVQGTLNGGGAVKPDKFVIADWSGLGEVDWGYTPNGEYSNSGAGTWWNPV